MVSATLESPTKEDVDAVVKDGEDTISAEGYNEKVGAPEEQEDAKREISLPTGIINKVGDSLIGALDEFFRYAQGQGSIDPLGRFSDPQNINHGRARPAANSPDNSNKDPKRGHFTEAYCFRRRQKKCH